MKRFAFKMYLKPGCEKEYERRHAAIWPELVKMIKDGGVSNYSIYWDKDISSLAIRSVPVKAVHRIQTMSIPLRRSGGT